MVNIYFVICLISFLILWEIIYILKRVFKFKILIPVENDSWIILKVESLAELLLALLGIGVLVGVVGFPIYQLYKAGYILETLIVIAAVGLFFGINYLFRKEK